jgi:hypothetical protein
MLADGYPVLHYIRIYVDTVCIFIIKIVLDRTLTVIKKMSNERDLFILCLDISLQKKLPSSSEIMLPKNKLPNF